jgi:hypothetical protein
MDATILIRGKAAGRSVYKGRSSHEGRGGELARVSVRNDRAH